VNLTGEQLDRLISAIHALRPNHDGVREWVLALGPVITFLGLWWITSWQLAKDSGNRERAAAADRKERFDRESRERDNERLRLDVERAERRHREFRVAVAAWVSAAFETVEAQRAYLDKLEELIDAQPLTDPLTIDARGFRPYQDLVRRTRLGVRQTSYLAEVHAPTLDLQRAVRKLTRESDLPSFVALPTVAADPSSVLGEKQTLEQQEDFLKRVSEFMEGLPG
jgi:hypothetical protein